MQSHPHFGIRVFDACQRPQHTRAASQFLADFAVQALFDRLAGFHFSAGEFP